mmetsp:Transcript_80185/g.214229  ORF Transcript_80185/g.214229 Transcript_80185/m.214229 type:complete len:228 (+) Transcript_80185:734-1417(+)
MHLLEGVLLPLLRGSDLHGGSQLQLQQIRLKLQPRLLHLRLRLRLPLLHSEPCGLHGSLRLLRSQEDALRRLGPGVVQGCLSLGRLLLGGQHSRLLHHCCLLGFQSPKLRLSCVLSEPLPPRGFSHFKLGLERHLGAVTHRLLRPHQVIPPGHEFRVGTGLALFQACFQLSRSLLPAHLTGRQRCHPGFSAGPHLRQCMIDAGCQSSNGLLLSPLRRIQRLAEAIRL